MSACRSVLRGVTQCAALGCVVALSIAAASAAEPAAPAVAPAPPKLHFVNDVSPILSRYGCNSGGCHGRATGQNGFKLSLFGFDPAADYAAIAEDGLGRRVSWTAPSDSLLLRKPGGKVEHGGGELFDTASSAYQVVANWIAAGTPWGAPDAPALQSIDVEPAARVAAAHQTGQLRVTARYSDGSRRDVTETAEFLNQSPAQVAVTPEGRVQTLAAAGEGIVAVRYQGIVAISRWTIPFRADPPAEYYANFAPVNYVDQLVLAQWNKLGIAPSPAASDAEFLRRAQLDVIGTLPTPQDIRDFLADVTPDKRDRLVDRLLDRPEYAVFWAQKWGDILRNRQGDAAQQDNSRKFTEWLRASFAANMRFDQFARSLVAVTGKIEDQPQMDWYRQLNSPQNRVEDTSQVFLGMRVSCANCHNHPFERISQDDYWRFAAFYARVDAMSYGTVKTVAIKKEGATTNPRTGQEMTPRAFGGTDVAYVEGEDTRLKLVEWMTAPGNPYFARTLANRLWAHYLKRGLVEPVDDHRATNAATNPELLDALAQDFVQNGYDIKQLTRTILRSRVYGLSSLPRPENVADAQSYARHYPQRLPPHVLLDAIDSTTGHKTQFQQFKDASRAIQLPNEFEQNDFLDIFGRSKRDTPCVCETRLEPNLSQILFLLFSPEIQQAIAHPEGVVGQLVKQEKPTVEIVDELYLRALSRLPSERDRQDAVAAIDVVRPRQTGVEDFLWTLLNSKEFLLNH